MTTAELREFYDGTKRYRARRDFAASIFPDRPAGYVKITGKLLRLAHVRLYLSEKIFEKEVRNFYQSDVFRRFSQRRAKK
jgi:hypothetical protein